MYEYKRCSNVSIRILSRVAARFPAFCAFRNYARNFIIMPRIATVRLLECVFRRVCMCVCVTIITAISTIHQNGDHTGQPQRSIIYSQLSL